MYPDVEELKLIVVELIYLNSKVQIFLVEFTRTYKNTILKQFLSGVN